MKKLLIFVNIIYAITLSAQEKHAEEISTTIITAAGKVQGKIVEIKMNKDGGRIASVDGKLELIIPQGALQKKTVISIQPLDNLAPNGNGKAYRLEPSGIKFEKPVQLVFHYNQEESSDSAQLFMGIAMQNETGQWFSLKKFTLDTVAKTLSGNINHFSDWSKFDAIKLYPSSWRLKVDKKLNMTIDLVSSEDEELTELDNGSDELMPLKKRSIPWTSTWRANEILNGNGVVGKIGVTSRTNILYSAPSIVPSQNPVAVTADLKGLNYKSKGVVFKDLKLVSNILIYADAYEVKITSRMKGDAGSVLGNVTYSDTGSFVVSLEKGIAKVIEKVNNNSSDDFNYAGSCTYVLLNKGSNHGNIHIAGVSGIKLTPATGPGTWPLVEINFLRSPFQPSILKITCPNPRGAPTTISTDNPMMRMIPSMPVTIKFSAKDEEQILEEWDRGGIYYKVTVNPIKEN
jgi:hypothetical protein